MNYQDPELQQRLAAEYVLGTLQGQARERFKRLLRQSPELQQWTMAWEKKLNPWANLVEPEPVPDIVWTNICARLGITAETSEAHTATITTLPSSKPHASKRPLRWSWSWGGSLAAAALVAGLLLFRPHSTPPASYQDIAIMAAEHKAANWIVRTDSQQRRLQISVLRTVSVDTNKDLQLWVTRPHQAPQSLGLVRFQAKQAELALTPAQQTLLAEGELLVVSIEPRNGSPTGQPTGPIMCQGLLVHV